MTFSINGFQLKLNLGSLKSDKFVFPIISRTLEQKFSSYTSTESNKFLVCISIQFLNDPLKCNFIRHIQLCKNNIDLKDRHFLNNSNGLSELEEHEK